MRSACGRPPKRSSSCPRIIGRSSSRSQTTLIRRTAGADDGIAISLVTLAVERVGDSYVPRFEVVSGPNAWLAEVQGVAPAEPVGIEAFLSSVRGEMGAR
jgi:hypothetical protein